MGRIQTKPQGEEAQVDRSARTQEENRTLGTQEIGRASCRERV